MRAAEKSGEALSPGTVGPSTRWILPESLLHCRSQPPSVGNPPSLSPELSLTTPAKCGAVTASQDPSAIWYLEGWVLKHLSFQLTGLTL